MKKKKRYIYFNLNLIYLIIIFISIYSLTYFYLNNLYLKKNILIKTYKMLNEIENENIKDEIKNKYINLKPAKSERFIHKKVTSFNKNNAWFLEIPSINLKKSKIKEGTEDETINKYIGHFYNTPYLDGNVCLAAHNRGFEENYFENLKDINIGEKIKYTVGKKEFTYIVSLKYIVHEEDISVLDESLSMILTLITCVSDHPQKRLVVKAEYIDI